MLQLIYIYTEKAEVSIRAKLTDPFFSGRGHTIKSGRFNSPTPTPASGQALSLHA